MNAREIALRVLKAVDEEKAYANIALNHYLERYRPGKLERAFATELVYGTLRRLNTLDWILGHFAHRPVEEQPVWIRNILRMGIYQLTFMNSVPPSAVCNEAAKLAHKFGHPGTVKFVNGVLRNAIREKENIQFPDLNRDPVAHISLCYSHPTWLVKKWIEEYGIDKTIEICRVNNEPAPVSIRTNTLKISRNELAARLQAEGLIARPTRYAPEGLYIEGFVTLHGFAPFEGGLFQVQDESSMLVAHALAPAKGTRILDAAAAPGGKTTHLAQLIENQGEILAIDIHSHRLRLLEENCRRLGVNCVQVLQADTRYLPSYLEQWADFVLLDAPCSALGVLRRRPDARWKKPDFSGLVKLQEELLEGVARCVKPGGFLVYSTCTINGEENQEQVGRFLKRHPEFIPEDLSFLLFGEQKTKYIQLFPHRQGMDGFFIARLHLKK